VRYLRADFDGIISGASAPAFLRRACRRSNTCVITCGKKDDFGWRAVTETARVAKALVKTYYGAEQKKAYFAGCSTGGRMANMEARKFRNPPPRDCYGPSVRRRPRPPVARIHRLLRRNCA
jgi:tannase/feruloyl esterase